MIIWSCINKFFRKLLHRGIKEYFISLYNLILVKLSCFLKVKYQSRHTLNFQIRPKFHNLITPMDITFRIYSRLSFLWNRLFKLNPNQAVKTFLRGQKRKIYLV